MFKEHEESYENTSTYNIYVSPNSSTQEVASGSLTSNQSKVKLRPN